MANMLDQHLKLDLTAHLFAESLERARGHQLEIIDLLACAEQLKSYGELQKVVELYKTWVAFNHDHTLLYAAYYNYAMALGEVPDLPGAVNALRETIRLKPDFFPPYINLGNFLERLGKPEGAIAEWLCLVNMFPTVNGDAITYKTLGLKQIGRVLEAAQNDTTAEALLKQSLDLDPHQTDVIQHWIALRMRQCKWPIFADSVWGKKANFLKAISPLSIACYADDPIFQLANAFDYNRNSIGVPTKARSLRAPFKRDRGQPAKYKIGYVSSDFREHAVGFSMTDVFETHNRESFEIFAYYCGIPGTDSTQQRIKAAADHWVDINKLDDEQAALRIREDAIDILVDLNGYTKDARTKIFALRPAPIGVNWFGFPGTMATPYHHYIIADSTIIPQDHEIYYSEKVLRLPCYQPNDRKRLVAAERPSRHDENLPEDAFVFCCLNGMQKLNPTTFQRWMTILGQVPDSVLWLLSGTHETNQRLQQYAEEQGVSSERLIFGSKKPNPAHLARYALADLFLDTFPYGAHTTAADAMWMGVPILTLAGRSFASRVCASLARAADIGELICSSGEEYIARAIEFGLDRRKLDVFKQRLVLGRDTSELFDLPKLVQHLEELYRGMWEDFTCAKLPQPDLSNLDIYHEIGAEKVLGTFELLSNDAYRSLYREQLTEWNDIFPIRPDGRLWF